MTILISIALLGVIASLGVALFFMLRGGKTTDAAPDESVAAKPPAAKGMAWALAVRVAISVVLFICVLISWKMGWISPTGLPAGK